MSAAMVSRIFYLTKVELRRNGYLFIGVFFALFGTALFAGFSDVLTVNDGTSEHVTVAGIAGDVENASLAADGEGFIWGDDAFAVANLTLGLTFTLLFMIGLPGL